MYNAARAGGGARAASVTASRRGDGHVGTITFMQGDQPAAAASTAGERNGARRHERRVLERFADLIVGFAANVQPGQVVAISTEPGKLDLTRAVADSAYRAGAKFVDVAALRPARQALADPARRGGHAGLRAAVVRRARARARRAARGAGRPDRPVDAGPAERPRSRARGARPAAVPARVRPRRQRAHDELDGGAVPDAAVGRARLPRRPRRRRRWSSLWEQVEHICRLDEDDPVAAWRERQDVLSAASPSG